MKWRLRAATVSFRQSLRVRAATVGFRQSSRAYHLFFPSLPHPSPSLSPRSSLASIFSTYWWVTRTAYTGDVWMPVMANAMIHTMMYYYFLLTSFGVKPRWDRSMTEAQMLQFCVMIAQGALNLVYGCAYPAVVSAFYVAYITFMLALFYSFYRQKYHRSGRSAALAAAGGKEKKAA